MRQFQGSNTPYSSLPSSRAMTARQRGRKRGNTHPTTLRGRGYRWRRTKNDRLASEGHLGSKHPRDERLRPSNHPGTRKRFSSCDPHRGSITVHTNICHPALNRNRSRPAFAQGAEAGHLGAGSITARSAPVLPGPVCPGLAQPGGPAETSRRPSASIGSDLCRFWFDGRHWDFGHNISLLESSSKPMRITFPRPPLRPGHSSGASCERRRVVTSAFPTVEYPAKATVAASYCAVHAISDKLQPICIKRTTMKETALSMAVRKQASDPSTTRTGSPSRMPTSPRQPARHRRSSPCRT